MNAVARDHRDRLLKTELDHERADVVAGDLQGAGEFAGGRGALLGFGERGGGGGERVRAPAPRIDVDDHEPAFEDVGVVREREPAVDVEDLVEPLDGQARRDGVRDEVDAGGLTGKGESVAGERIEVAAVEPAGKTPPFLANVEGAKLGALVRVNEPCEVGDDGGG